MRRNEYIAALLCHFTGPFLRAVAARDPSAMAHLKHCHCEVDPSAVLPSIKFSLTNIFDALWRHAATHGFELPRQSDWDKDFKEFCERLMFPWPVEGFDAVGYKIRVLRKTNCNAKWQYELSPT